MIKNDLLSKEQLLANAAVLILTSKTIKKKKLCVKQRYTQKNNRSVSLLASNLPNIKATNKHHARLGL